MNDNKAVEQMGLIDGPGTILRRAREDKGLDVEAIAAMLHLSELKVKAIEADDFDSLPEPVFIRGYLKNYARLLEEPVDPVLDAYAKFGYESEAPKQVLVESDSKVEVNGSGDHDLVRIISIVVMVAIVAIPAIVWWDDLAQIANEIISSGEEQQSELAISSPSEGKKEFGVSISIPIPGALDSEVTGKPSVVGENKDSLEKAIQLEPEQKPVVSAIKPLEPVKIETMPLSIPPQPVVEEIKPEPKPIKKSVPKPVVVAKPAKPAPVENGVWFNFVESGWVKVRDAKNRVILIGEHQKGTIKRLTSTMPYKVVLGNSNAVKVEIGGKIANIDKYSSGGVARFTIVDGKIDKP